MRKPRSKKIDAKLKVDKERKLGLVFIFIGLAGFIAAIYNGRQYDLTLIKFEYVVAIYLVAGLTFGTITFKSKEKSKGRDFNLFTHFIWAVFIYGSILTGLFYFTNKQFANNKDYESSFLILEKHSAYRSLTNRAILSVEDFTKEISFPNSNMVELYNANYVSLTLRKGFWGFPIIKNSNLTRR